MTSKILSEDDVDGNYFWTFEKAEMEGYYISVGPKVTDNVKFVDYYEYEDTLG